MICLWLSMHLRRLGVPGDASHLLAEVLMPIGVAESLCEAMLTLTVGAPQ